MAIIILNFSHCYHNSCLFDEDSSRNIRARFFFQLALWPSVLVKPVSNWIKANSASMHLHGMWHHKTPIDRHCSEKATLSISKQPTVCPPLDICNVKQNERVTCTAVYDSCDCSHVQASTVNTESSLRLWHLEPSCRLWISVALISAKK